MVKTKMRVYCKTETKKLVLYVTAVASKRRRRQLANVIAIAKAFANWTETLPSLMSRDTKCQKLGQISKICSVQKLDIVP